jgi:spore germination protein GerM
LFYGSLDGQALIPLRREVPLADGLVLQGAQILRAQLAEAPPPLVSVIPKGTSLRAFYVTDRGDAFVDLSREVSAAHPGGSLMELMTVYAVVNAVTANLPKVQRVQILVDGKSVDTIAGHVDVRRPLARDVSLVREK